MPEGHTIHRIARDHHAWFAGQKLLVCSPQGRFENEADVVSGKKLKSVSAHGKHLFYRWTSKLILHVHLGLYGKFRTQPVPPPEPRGAVRVRMMGKEKAFDLVGPNCCELITQKDVGEYQGQLGEDPLHESASLEKVWNAFQKSRSPVGSVLLNQKVIAGIGNIYRAEILYLLGIHPMKPAKEVTRDELEELWSLAQHLMEIGAQHNRIITAGLSKKNQVPKRLRKSERFHVYKRDNCGKCGTAIESWQLANRSMFACPACQSR